MSRDPQRRSDAIRSLPEVQALDSARDSIRISPEVNVPLTPRVRRLVDCAAFRRLARISQLGLVSLVYPSATHTRFEHSLGVYRQALLYLRHLSYDERFAAAVSERDAGLLVVSALLHDLGHWPFCHPIEDMKLDGVPRHEELTREILAEDETAAALREDWGFEPGDVADLLEGRTPDDGRRLVASLLSGPIDADKLDYLGRDSLHAGVPYGNHFDPARLISSLCVNEAGDGVAITDKGKTAAELMVFARYVMFSEVYWHHAVRAATAMLQRAFFLLHGRLDLRSLFRLREEEMVSLLLQAAADNGARELLAGLFGDRRVIYKRVAQYSIFEDGAIYARVRRRPYPWLVGMAAQLASLAAERTGAEVLPEDVLVDAPPVEKEVEFDVEVHFRKEGAYRRLEEISPVVRALAREQFDDFVKRVRIFVHPRRLATFRACGDLRSIAIAAADRASGGDGKSRA